MRTFNLVIGGKLVPGASHIDVLNPATEKPVAQCPTASEAQVNEAVAAAKAAFPAWSATSIEERQKLILKLVEALEARASEFASLLTSEQGKPLDQAHYEIAGAARVLRAFAGMTLQPKVLRDDGNNKVVELRVPLGVIAAITPWNFPLILLANKLGPALLAGNTVVAKPAPTTPLTSLLLGEVALDILPAGVFNVIADNNDMGAVLSSHPDVAKVAFTGSTATGKKVMASASGTVKRVTLELGGNDAAIVLDDVDPVDTAGRVFRGAMANGGQICVAIKRAYVPESIYEPFCDELARLAKEVVVDDGANQGAQMGPVQNRQQYEKLKEYLADARENGNVIAGGDVYDRDGYFVQPTIVRDIPDTARIVREEQFGPILPVLKYNDIDDVIARANDSEYGLGGTVWGKDVARATEVASKINSGTVWVNQYLAIDPTIPFRGAKQSGLGAELGEDGLLEYTQGRVINAVSL